MFVSMTEKKKREIGKGQVRENERVSVRENERGTIIIYLKVHRSL